jgi:hypothetical protein
MTLLEKAMRYEWLMWSSLFRWIFRRPVAEPGARTFGYASTASQLIIVFIAVSAIEIPIAHMLLPWAIPRLIVDIAGVYGLLWMLGLLAMVRVRPHVLTAEGVRIRHTSQVDVRLRWSDIAQVGSRNRPVDSRGLHIEQAIASVPAMKQTNVDVVLHQPMTVPGVEGEQVTEVRFYADDPDALVRLARQHLVAVPDRLG